MADAKYVVGDHRNGDAKIELDANKRQFSGLTKEELLKYADDPFWVRLRWFMFALFWALWLCMLAGAIAIIVRAPSCNPPPPKTWYEKGPLVDTAELDSYDQLEGRLSDLKRAGVRGIFTDVVPTYDVLDDPSLLERFAQFVTEAKKYSVNVIVDLTPNFVSTSHQWFALSVNRTAPYTDYFTWAKPKDYDGDVANPPNNWVSTHNTSAWEWNEARKEFYLHQYGTDQPDLNFHNEKVAAEFQNVLRLYMAAGADGVRLNKVRQILVNSSYPDEELAAGLSQPQLAADHTTYRFWSHAHTSDQRALRPLLAGWAAAVESAANGTKDATVFTIKEDGDRLELFLKEVNATAFRPPAAAPAYISGQDVPQLVAALERRLPAWPALQLSLLEGDSAEVAALALLLPAAPVLPLAQLLPEGNDTADSARLSHLSELRSDPSVEHGSYRLAAVPAKNDSRTLIAVARWKKGRTGYAAVLNPWEDEQRVALDTRLRLPQAATLYHATAATRLRANYTANMALSTADVLVPAKSSVVLSFVPLDEQ